MTAVADVSPFNFCGSGANALDNRRARHIDDDKAAVSRVRLSPLLGGALTEHAFQTIADAAKFSSNGFAQN